MVQLTLLIPVRGRTVHVRSVLPLLRTMPLVRAGQCQLLIVESGDSPLHDDFCASLGAGYLFCEDDGPFHKTKLMNLGLAIAAGEIIAPYDIDLIPYNNSLERHGYLASISSDLLITGFRLMTTHTQVPENIDHLLEGSSVASENGVSAIRKWLIDGERFGIVPHFSRRRLEAIGGWDEKFRGWGCEDQDVIERYLGTERYMLSSPDILYLHLSHPFDQGWAEDEYKHANAVRYYAKRQANRPGIS